MSDAPCPHCDEGRIPCGCGIRPRCGDTKPCPCGGSSTRPAVTHTYSEDNNGNCWMCAYPKAHVIHRGTAPTVTDAAADALCTYREHVAPEPNDMTSSGISWREGTCLCWYDAEVVLSAARARQENHDE